VCLLRVFIVVFVTFPVFCDFWICKRVFYMFTPTIIVKQNNFSSLKKHFAIKEKT